MKTIYIQFHRYDEDIFYSFSEILAKSIELKLNVEIQLIFQHFKSDIFY
jgi:hypothetical protein